MRDLLYSVSSLYSIFVSDEYCRKQATRVHEETLGEDKGIERSLECSWIDCACVMLGFYFVILGFMLYM